MIDSDLTPSPASASKLELATIMEIVHANHTGNIHGGTIMKLVDTAAGYAAIKHCQRPTATVAIDDMTFLVPVHVGDLLVVKAMVNEVFGTSMEVGVRVEVERVLGKGRLHVSSAHLVFVALDDNGRPTKARPILVETDEERQRQAAARVRREQRLAKAKALEHAGDPR
jgi:acyl-CoA hydrolase